MSLLVAYKQSDSHTLVRATLKPTRSLLTTQADNSGALCLVPLSPSIGLVADGVQLPPQAVPFGVVINTPRCMQGYVSPKMVLNAPPTAQGCATREAEPFTAPYWFIRPTPDAAVANLEASTQKVTVDVVAGKSGVKRLCMTCLCSAIRALYLQGPSFSCTSPPSRNDPRPRSHSQNQWPSSRREKEKAKVRANNEPPDWVGLVCGFMDA